MIFENSSRSSTVVSGRHRENAELDRRHDSFSPIARLQLYGNVIYVIANGVLAYLEDVGYFLISESFR